MALRSRYVPQLGRRQRRTAHRLPLQAVEPRLYGPLVPVRGGQQHPGADELELQPRRRGAAHLRQPLADQVRGPAELRRAERLRLRPHPLQHVVGDVDEPLGARVGHRGEDHEVPQPLEQVGDEPPRIVAPLDDPVHDLERGGPVTRREGVDDGVQQRRLGVPEQGRRHGIRHTVRARAGQQLVHHGHGVPYGPRPGPYHQRQHGLLDGDPLLAADLGEIVPQRPGGDEPERIVMGPRPDGPDDLLGLCRREDELQMLRGLLDDLQQGVEPRRGDHVGLVDDVDLVPAGGGSEEGLLPQLTGVVHATVRRGVDLDDVDRPGPVARQVQTRPALPAGGGRGALLTVQTAGEDPRAGGLAAPPWTAEQIRVVDPVVPQRLLQRTGHVVLPDDLGEGLGAITAIEG
ncbi:hypothetical protein SRB5_71330 [Streptomyces sp. RB5]|uniref:Uncharacterized protein n=1 Tax=Streptomyces smaragdinus TaxID=2585196 RepID=A0A7K0CU17_9ACTN|nr:hypothetical protein [Streptomyces smaragdinus]